VFVLSEVFAFELTEIAEVVGRSPDACRQVAARFFDAIRDGDIGALQDLLAADVTMVGDSGGKAPLWGKGVFSGTNVARLLVSLMPWFFQIGGSFEPEVVNGQIQVVRGAHDARRTESTD
jgi:RNA polymerase sigma-70 factor (ECF subfamily)